MKNKQIVLLSALSLVLMFVGTGCRNSSKPGSSIHIFVLGDWGREGTQFQTPVRDQMVNWAKKKPIDLVISTGDNFYENGVRSVADSQWNTSFENIYSDSSLQVPWIVSLGNHDYRVPSGPESEIAYTATSKRWYMPSRYFEKDYTVDPDNSMSIFIVDTSPFLEKYQKEDTLYHVLSQSTDRQIAWLDSALGASKSKWKFVAGHHPIYSASAKEGNTKELVEKMLPVLKKHHVRAYICGHNHNLQHMIKDGMDFYVSGGGSQAKDGAETGTEAPYAETQAGFLDLVVTADATTATFVDPWGHPRNVSTMNP